MFDEDSEIIEDMTNIKVYNLKNELMVYPVVENIRMYVNCVSVFFSELDAKQHCESNRDFHYEKHKVK